MLTGKVFKFNSVAEASRYLDVRQPVFHQALVKGFNVTSKSLGRYKVSYEGW